MKKNSFKIDDDMLNHYNLCSRWAKIFSRLGIGCSLLFFAVLLNAQPSGGPYGPVAQTYELPKVSGNIYYVAPDGKAEAKGDQLLQPTTIEVALEHVKTGDAIVLRGGTYRTGNLELNQGITMQPYADEQPVFKGTYEAKQWKKLGNGLWRIKWTRFFPQPFDSWWDTERYANETPKHRFNDDMVFVDGKFLQSAGWEGEVNENTYYIDYDSGHVYIANDPAKHLVEITAFNVGLHRVKGECHGKTSDRIGPVIRGITFTQYAYRAIDIDGFEPEGLANEADFGKDVVGTVLENVTISYCSRVAAYLRGDKLVMRNCKIHDTSTEGIYLLASSDVLLERNIFSRNNIEYIYGYYPAAVKIFNQTHRVTCRDNLIIDLPLSNGIWYDVGNVDGRFINNWVEDVGCNREIDNSNTKSIWPSYNGFFFEISKGAICAGNVFVNCFHGIMVLNASNVQVYQNTFVNSTVCIARYPRNAVTDHFGWHPSTGPGDYERFGHVFVNNLLSADKKYSKPMMLVWQPDSMYRLMNQPPLKQFDNNVFVRNTENRYDTIAFWSLAKNQEGLATILSLEELQKASGASANSRYFKNVIPLFKSAEIGNYQLLPSSPVLNVATQMPVDVKKLLDLPKTYKKYVGAYPVK